MKANTFSLGSINLVSLGLGITAALLVIVVLSGRKLPLISGYKPAIVALVVLGLAICTNSGIGRVSAAGVWSHPLAILGYILGALILLVSAAGLLGLRLPFVPDARAAFVAASGLVASKVVVGLLHRLLALL